MEERRYIVYIHTNLENNKKYIGLTSLAPNNRWRNGNGYCKSVYFNRAIQKYGWHNFKHEVVLQNLTKQEAEMFEIEMIKYYKTTDRKNGYNIDNGGNSSGKRSQETIEKIRLSNIGKKRSDETKKRISENRKGKCTGSQNYGFGKHLSAKTKEKLKNINSKKIICIETKEIFNSAKEAGDILGIDYATIGRCCRKDFHIGAGFHWAFYDEYIKNPDDNIYLTSRKKTGKTVYCEETKEYYPSLKHVSDLFKIDLSYLGKCMRKGKICKGYHFKYIDKQ